MLRVILVLLIGLGAALYFPQTHDRVVELASPLLNPVMAWSTKGEMNAISGKLQALSRVSGPFPDKPREFTTWMEDNYQGSAAVDAWGSRYTLKIWPDSFAVVSAGPDGVRGTADDVLVTALLKGDISGR